MHLFCFAAIIPVSNAYIFVSQSKNWYDAKAYCQAQYSQTLASFSTTSEWTELWNGLRAMGGGQMWIGLNDIHQENGWVNDDGSSYSVSNMAKFWCPGEPNNYQPLGGEDCAHFGWCNSGYSTLNDIPCRYSYKFACNGHTPKPTPKPTPRPTPMPTNRPTDRPTPMPTLIPTSLPTIPPTNMPTSAPTSACDRFGFDHGHVCGCVSSECDGAMCNPAPAVAKRLKLSAAYASAAATCPNSYENCCCSCPNCVPYLTL